MAFAWTVLFRDDCAVKKFRPASTPFVMSTKPLAFGVSIPSVRLARNVVNCHMYGYCSIRGIPLADLVHVLPFKSVSVEAQKALSKIEYLEGDSVTKMKEYDDVVRSLWEAKQLYEQFRWNYGELRRLVPCDQFDFLPDGFANGGLARGLLLTLLLEIMFPQPVVLSIECRQLCGSMTEVQIKNFIKTIGNCLLLGMTKVASMFLCMRFEIQFSMVKPLFRLSGKMMRLGLDLILIKLLICANTIPRQNFAPF